MIEQLAQDLIAALNRNTEALLASQGKAAAPNAGTSSAKTAPAASGAKAPAAKKEAPKPKHSEDDVVAALTKIKEEFGADPAKEIVKELGFAKMAEITPDKYDLAVELAEKKYAELSEGGSKDDDGDL